MQHGTDQAIFQPAHFFEFGARLIPFQGIEIVGLVRSTLQRLRGGCRTKRRTVHIAGDMESLKMR